MGQKRKPVHRFNLGRIRAAIFANPTKNQDVWFNVEISRRYLDQGQWKDADTYSHEELPIVAKAADMAYSWIWRRRMARDKATNDNAEK
jgi:hypothetical protein